MDRRTALKTLSAAGAGVVAVGLGHEVRGRQQKKAAIDAVCLLFDATRCAGCQACVRACKTANNMPPDLVAGIYDAPRDLNDTTLSVIKAVPTADHPTYVKRQCMHCIDPACVSACMLGALQKTAQGVVAYDVDRCIGCRYCQVACPFNVPKFEWQSATPQIRKCEFCQHRKDKGPACAEVCPTGAVISGPLAELAAIAHERIRRHPKRYVDRVYGLREGGGTQVLYLSPVNHTRLGLPALSHRPVPELSETVQHGIYRGFAVPVALYAALGFVLWRNRGKTEPQDREG